MTELKINKKIEIELKPYIDEMLERVHKVRRKGGYATIQLNAKVIIQDGKVTQLTFNEEHIKIKEEEICSGT